MAVDILDVVMKGAMRVMKRDRIALATARVLARHRRCGGR